MLLPAFTPPPLILRVSQLDHVPGRPLHRSSGILTPDDVRNDALYQKLALDNQRIQRHRGWLGVMVLALAGLLFGGLSLRQPRTPVATPQSVATPLASHVAPLATTQVAPTPPTPPATASVASTQPIGTEVDESLKRIVAIEAQLQAIRASQEKATPPERPAAAPGVLTVVPRMAATAPMLPQGAPATTPKALSQSTSQPAAQPAKAAMPTPAPQALPAIKLIDFFGLNTAVMLSISGGDAERTYRVGDVLPGGETITGINSQLGQMQTSKRTINK